MRAVDDLANDWFERPAGLLPIIVRYASAEGLQLIAGDQIDGGAAEAASGEPGAEARGVPSSELDEEIQFGGAVMEMVTGTFVTLKHVLAELGEISVAQGAVAEDDALHFAADVIGALELAFSKFLATCIQQRQID